MIFYICSSHQCGAYSTLLEELNPYPWDPWRPLDPLGGFRGGNIIHTESAADRIGTVKPAKRHDLPWEIPLGPTPGEISLGDLLGDPPGDPWATPGRCPGGIP
jgi:hypothetical protein